MDLNRRCCPLLIEPFETDDDCDDDDAPDGNDDEDGCWVLLLLVVLLTLLLLEPEVVEDVWGKELILLLLKIPLPN